MPNWFLDKTRKKGLKWKSEHHYKNLHIEISLATKFCLKLTILNFWIKLTQKGYFRTKNKRKIYRILHIKMNLNSKFQLEQFWFLEQIFQRK